MNPAPASASRIVALAGGVGAARFLAGLVRVVDPAQLTVIVNTGDDRDFYGVHVSPDLDIVTYTLAGLVDREKGYGLAGDSFQVVETLGALGHPTWFRLGDRDFAHCLHRTLRLREGVGLAAVTDEMRRAHRLALRLLPMSEDACPTYVGCAAAGASTSRSISRATARPTKSSPWTSAPPRRRAPRRAPARRSRRPT